MTNVWRILDKALDFHGEIWYNGFTIKEDNLATMISDGEFKESDLNPCECGCENLAIPIDRSRMRRRYSVSCLNCGRHTAWIYGENIAMMAWQDGLILEDGE